MKLMKPCFDVRHAESHIWFMAMLVETPLETVWREHLELLVVLIAKCQGAT